MEKKSKKFKAIVLYIVLALISISSIYFLFAEFEESPVDLGDGRMKVPVVFEGGFDTKPVDRGRPVILIASALGVEEQVFRDAFSRVNPAPGGTIPSGERVHENKKVLMQALGPHGITNERLDEVSNYYRYSRGLGQLWRHRSAKAYAIVKEGNVIEFQIANGGSGYSSPPKISVQGIENLKAKVDLSFGKEFATNGSIKSIELQ